MPLEGKLQPYSVGAMAPGFTGTALPPPAPQSTADVDMTTEGSSDRLTTEEWAQIRPLGPCNRPPPGPATLAELIRPPLAPTGTTPAFTEQEMKDICEAEREHRLGEEYIEEKPSKQ